MVSNSKLPQEFRLAFNDDILVREYIMHLQRISRLLIYIYLLTPQIALLFMKSIKIITSIFIYYFNLLSFLLIDASFIIIELLIIDIAIAVAVCCKDKNIETLAWSAIAFTTYCGWWGFQFLGKYAYRYSMQSLECAYLVNYFIGFGAVLSVILVALGKSIIISHAKRCALNRLANEGCS